MPVTAKLSKAFYEAIGERPANELVEWFNAVDATYRADLRELNELNFSRFDAKLEQRLAELRLQLETKLEQRIAEVRASIAELEVRLERRLGEQTRWMFVAWATLMVAIIGFGLR